MRLDGDDLCLSNRSEQSWGNLHALILIGRIIPGKDVPTDPMKASLETRSGPESAEAYGASRSGGVRPGELTALEFPLNGNYGITVAKMGHEAKGILLGPVVVGGASFNAVYGLIRDDR